MDVLLIAPNQPDLSFQQAEVERLVNTLNAKVRLGNVTCADVMDAVATHRPEILWFSSHGDRDGVFLSDCLLDGDMLAAAIRGTPTKLIFLNSCDSRATAERIYAQTQCHVIATIGAVDDRHAYTTALKFAKSLIAGGNVYAAYQDARTPTFVYIPETMNGNSNGYEGLRRLVAEQQIKIDSLERLVDEMRANGVRNDARYESLQSSLNRRFQQMQTSQWVVAGLVIVLLVLQLSQVLQ